jgi:hypothetical protein
MRLGGSSQFYTQGRMCAESAGSDAETTCAVLLLVTKHKHKGNPDEAGSVMIQEEALTPDLPFCPTQLCAGTLR